MILLLCVRRSSLSKMIFDLDDIGKVKDKELSASSVSPPLTVSPCPQSTGVVKRVYHTRQEFTVYPNGQIYLGKIQGWFEDKIYQVKKVVKKKATAPKKIMIKTEEVY